MELSRQALIDRCQSKVSSIDEFNFDMLTAPPLAMLLTQQDIDNLYRIATSVKYSGNPKKKYEAIDAIMNARGFVKLSAGTNRITYRHLESNAFVVKVAADDIGIGDNPREFKNQFIFKPFVTKVFEVSPCGTVGVFERVNPITSREEFLSVADDIYDVINEWFIGKYVMADIGTKFFMNWGIRHHNSFREGSVAFGPVLLDFPYVYELDGNKLFCSAVDHNSPNGRCGGIIDYDDGFNFLVCNKCGVKYRVKELAKSIEENKISINKLGRSFKMKMGHFNKDGQVVVNKEIVTKTPVSKVGIVKASDKPIGSFKMGTPKSTAKEEVVENKKSDPGENRGVVKAAASNDNDAVAKEYQNIIDNKNTPSFNDLIKEEENKEYTFVDYDAEYDVVTLTNGTNHITAKLSEIIPEDEKQSIVENSDEYKELEDIRKDIKIKVEEISGLKDEIEKLKKELEEAKENQTTVINGLPTDINKNFEDFDMRYYGDAIVLDGMIDQIQGFASPEIPGRNVIVFPLNASEGNYCTSDDEQGNPHIIVVGSINGYLIDDLLQAVEEKEDEDKK